MITATKIWNCRIFNRYKITTDAKVPTHNLLKFNQFQQFCSKTTHFFSVWIYVIFLFVCFKMLWKNTHYKNSNSVTALFILSAISSHLYSKLMSNSFLLIIQCVIFYLCPSLKFLLYLIFFFTHIYLYSNLHCCENSAKFKVANILLWSIKNKKKSFKIDINCLYCTIYFCIFISMWLIKLVVWFIPIGGNKIFKRHQYYWIELN